MTFRNMASSQVDILMFEEYGSFCYILYVFVYVCFKVRFIKVHSIVKLASLEF